MAYYNITIAVTYECRGPDNTLYEQDSTLYLIVEGNSPSDDFTAEIEAAVEENRPVNCAGRPNYSYTVDPTVFPTEPEPETEPPPPLPPGEPFDLGEMVTVEGLATLVCTNGTIMFRTVMVDVPSTFTRAEVQAELEQEAENMVDNDGDKYPCVVDNVKIVAPVYFLYMRD